MTFTKQEAATVLAALRYWEADFGLAGGKLRMPFHFKECDPLTTIEIDKLCERINFDEDTAQGFSETNIREADAEEIELGNEEGPPLTAEEIRNVFDRLAFDEQATEAAHERMMDIIDDVRSERIEATA